MKPFTHFKLALAFLAAIVSVSNSSAQGSLRATYFPGSGVLTPTPIATTNSYVDLGTDLKDSLATTSFTIELWVKMGATNSVNPVIIGDKDWASGSNTGFVLSYYASTDASSGTAGANTLRFNFKPASGTRVDYDMVFPAAIAQKWNHIAVTINRTGSIQGYLNGIATGQAYTAGTGNISADAGKTIAGTMPVRLGTDGKPFGYRAPFNGTMDEVRIWKTVRTAQELRDNMCHKLSGNESDLVAYYRMDEASGTTINNNATANATRFIGTMINATSRVGSGAPVGDTSVNVYTTTWAGASLQLSTTNHGVFTVDSFSNPGAYMHLYQINALPDSLNGLTAYSNNNVYFGVFAPDTFSYYPKYGYGNYTNAVTFKNTIGFFTRVFNADPIWTSKTNRYNNTAANLMRIDSVNGSRQFFLANFINTCNVPSGLGATNVQANSAVLNWTSGGSALWNIQYGPAGFTLGNGVKINAANANPYTLNGLQGNTAYQFYVQDTCTGVGVSSWAGPYSFNTSPDLASFGSGYAIHFNGSGVVNTPIQAVNMGGVTRDSLATSDFTIEMWVKVGATNVGNPPLIADKDYVSGANTGICWTYTASVLYGDAAAHVFRFNFKPAGGTRRDYDMIAPNEFTWNHLAITVDRRGFIKGYVNGVYKPSLYSTGAGSVAADSGKTLAGTMPLYLGTDGTGAYRVPFNGDMDEVRIWKGVRTESEIRASMCHKLNGNEQGLVTYYRLNEPSGNSVINSATATTGLMNGTTVNNPARVVSSAPLGDTSVLIYPANGWNGISLNFNTGDKGVLTVDSVAGQDVPGVHVYMVNGLPNYQAGIGNIGSTNKYLGVFTANDATASYRVQYDYSNYTNAVTNSANVHLYNRPDNAATLWAQTPATHNQASHVFNRNSSLGVRQYLLADFTANACAAPTNILLNNVDTTSANFSWTSSAAAHKTTFGPSGFNLGTGAVTKITANTQTINSLVPATGYDFYIQDSCGGGNTSAWVGPYHFETTNACPKVLNVHADSVTDNKLVLKWTDNGTSTMDYVIAWGISGTFTDPSIAIQQNTSSPRYVFNGLQNNTSYDFYVRSNCNASIRNSAWVGPVTYKTDSTSTPPTPTSIASSNLDHNLLRVYPNPASDRINIELLDHNAGGFTDVAIFNSLGMRVYTQSLTGNNQLAIPTANLPEGLYQVELRAANKRMHQAIIIQHQ